MNTKQIMVGILGSLGMALGASAACPPEDCSVKSVEGVKLLELRPTLREGSFLELTPTLREGQHLEVIPAVREGKLIEVRPTLMDSAKSAYRTLSLAQSMRPEEAQVRYRVANKQGESKGDQNVVVVQDGDTVSLRMRDGKVLSLERNGKEVPADRVKKDGERIVILDENGKQIREFTLGQQAQAFALAPGKPLTLDAYGQPTTAWTIQADPPKVMIGVQLGEPDGLLLGHFGLEPGSATLITGVYEGLPADKAGVKPYDIVVAINGKEPAGQAEVREAIRDLDENDKVTLTIIHKGERRDVKVSLVKYDQEALGSAKLSAIEQDSMTFALGGDGSDNMVVAPGLPPLRNFQGADPERMREFAEQWRLEAEKLAERYKDAAGPGAAPSMRWETTVPSERRTPAPPAPPGAPRASNEERWQRLEERMARLEKLIERLAEQKAGGSRP